MRFVGIDPSTKTGLVALDSTGNVLRAKELNGVGNVDPKRMITLIDDIMRHIQPDDFIVIEGFGYASQQAIQLGGIGWGIRMSLTRRGYKYTEVSPSAVKKFATGKGNVKKEDMVLPLFKHWGFEHSSDNVRDAFVLAQIAKKLHWALSGGCIPGPQYQLEVLDTLINPKPKTKKKKKAK